MAWIGWRWGVGGCVLALACGGNGSDDGATSQADGTDDAADDDDDDGPTDPSADDDDDGPTDPSADDDDDTSADDSITDTDPSETSSDEGPESTTGEDTLCGIQEEVGDAPWFELSHYGDPVVDGSVLSLECGGQGSWMFFLSADIGGWTPAEEHVYFSVTVDVPGQEGPTGHFFQSTMYGQYVGCEEFDGGGAPAGIAIIPPDTITDLTVLDGLAGTLHVELLADGNPTLDAEIELAIPPELNPEKGCNPFG